LLSPSQARGIHLGFLVLLLCMLLLIVLATLSSLHLLPDPLVRWTAILTACPFRARTGTPCRLCGTTTAAVLLVRGEVARSLSIHPLPLFAGPGLILQIAYRGYRCVRPILSVREEVLLILTMLSLGTGALLIAPES
jgi:hypothetical protein